MVSCFCAFGSCPPAAEPGRPLPPPRTFSPVLLGLEGCELVIRLSVLLVTSGFFLSGISGQPCSGVNESNIYQTAPARCNHPSPPHYPSPASLKNLADSSGGVGLI